RLLDEIRESASQFTFQFYLQQFPKDPSYVDWQTPTFRQFSKNGKTISQDILQQDVEQLETLTRKVEQLADRSFAHLDKRGFGDMVTFGDLDACIDAFDQLVCKYLSLITAEGYSSLEPTILFNWEKIFRVPQDMKSG